MLADATRRIGILAGLIIFLAVLGYGLYRIPEDSLRRLEIFVGVITFLALLWYSWETRQLRQSTDAQTEALLMPVLRLTRRDGRLFVKNSGHGIARDVRLQPIHYANLAGDVITCGFRPVFALATEEEDELRAGISRLEVGEDAPKDLKPERLADVLEIAGFGPRTWTQKLYFRDTRGRAHEINFQWENPDRPVEAVGMGNQEPKATDIRRVKTIPDPFEPVEIRGISRLP